MRLRLALTMRMTPSKIDSMPPDDYYDLCALLSLEPLPETKIDLGLANLAWIISQTFGSRTDFSEMLPYWMKLGQPPSMQEKINEWLNKGIPMEEIAKYPEVLEYNRSRFKHAAKSLKATIDGGRRK